MEPRARLGDGRFAMPTSVPWIMSTPQSASIAAVRSSCTHSATVSISKLRARSISVFDEDLVVVAFRQVLDEGAVDLDHVDVEAAEIAEGREAGAEIVDRDPAAEVVQDRDEVRRLLDIADDRAFR